MKKIRIPRKLKKDIYVIRKLGDWRTKRDEPKVLKYHSYFKIERGMKIRKMSPEDLVRYYSIYMMDDVIWWYWVRKKELGIEPTLLPLYQEYWDEIVEHK